MDDAVLVGVGDGFGDRQGHLCRPAWRQRAVLDVAGERVAVDEAHREVVLAADVADLVDGNDAGMVEVGGSLGLDQEAADLFLRCQLAGEDHLQGDDAAEATLLSLEDHSHAAPSDLFDQVVVAEARSRLHSARAAGGGRWQTVGRHLIDVGREGLLVPGVEGGLVAARGQGRLVVGALR